MLGKIIIYNTTLAERNAVSSGVGATMPNQLAGQISEVHADGSVKAKILFNGYGSDIYKDGLIQGTSEGQYQIVI